jgi:hypothetical protein
VQLDDAVLPPLTEEEQARLATVRAGLLAAAKTEAEKVRAAYTAERAAAGRAVSWIDDDERTVLEGSHEIVLTGGAVVTVDDILADPARYHDASCADPREPDYRGDDRIAVIKTDGFPNIYSHAHGGQLFLLRQSAQADFTADSSASPATGTIAPLPTDGERIAAILGDAMPSLYREVSTLHGPELLCRWETLQAATHVADPLDAFFHSAVLPLADSYRSREPRKFRMLLRSRLEADRGWGALSVEAQELLLAAAWAFAAPPLTLMNLGEGGLVQEVDIFGAAEPRVWTVEGLVPAASVGAVYGPPKSMKTFVVTDLAARIAAGIPFRGREVQRGGILYFASESVPQIVERVRAWVGMHRDCSANFRLIPKALPLLDPAETLRQIAARVQFPSGDPVRLVVIDVLRSSITNEKENEIMAAAAATAQLAARAFGVSVVIVHHSPRQDSTRMSGGNALDGGVDWGWSVEKRDETATVTVRLCRDGSDGENWKVHILDNVLHEGAGASVHGQYSADLCAAELCRVLPAIAAMAPVSRDVILAELSAIFPKWFTPNESVARGTVNSRTNRVIQFALRRGWIAPKGTKYVIGPTTPPPAEQVVI